MHQTPYLIESASVTSGSQTTAASNLLPRNSASAADKAQNRLLELKASVDELEEALEVPTLLSEANQFIEWTEDIVRKWGTPSDQSKFRIVLAELKATMEARVPNPADLTRRIENLDDLRMKVLRSKDEWWLDYMGRLEEHKEGMTNQALAEQLFAQARRSINNNDIEGVKNACRQLVQLLPEPQQRAVGRFQSSVT